MPEAPRDVYLSACREIASSLDPARYRFAASGPHCSRRSGDFTFQIDFQSSHYNCAGEHVALCVHVLVRSPRIKRWRAVHPALQGEDRIARGQIGELRPEAPWGNWELADPRRRGDMIQDVVTTIRELAFPYFARFDELDSLIAYLTAHELPLMGIAETIEFLLCFADADAARSAARRFLTRRPDLVEGYTRALQRWSTDPYRHPSGYAEQLAFASQVLGLGLIAP